MNAARKTTKLLYGVGINDSGYVLTSHGVDGGKYRKTSICPFYQCWAGMIERGYSQKTKARYPSYKETTVCSEWLLFSNFKAWMQQQDWQGKHLDKDIIVEGNQVYSPDSCAFVSPALNNFCTDTKAKRGKWPIGVSWHKCTGRFNANCRNPFTRKKQYLGSFDCPDQAYQAWKAYKHELACQLADIQTDARVAQALRVRYQPAAE